MIPIWVSRVKLSRTATWGPRQAWICRRLRFAKVPVQGGPKTYAAETDFPALTVRAISAVGVEVPMAYALGTSRGRITKAPLLLIDVETAEGVTGRSYLWSLFSPGHGGDREHPPGGRGAHQGRARGAGRTLEQTRRTLRADRRARHRPHGDGGLRRRLLGCACDRAGVPLVRLLGGEPRRIPAYNSCGLGLMPADALADEAEKLLERGFRAVKLRLGYPTLGGRSRCGARRQARIPQGVALMVDYNQALGRR